MRTIWKFPIALREGQSEITADLPAEARTVLVGIDPASGHPALWVEFDPDQPRSTRRLRAFGTGHPIPPKAEHVGSTIDGVFVWHIYEVQP